MRNHSFPHRDSWSLFSVTDLTCTYGSDRVQERGSEQATVSGAPVTTAATGVPRVGEISAAGVSGTNNPGTISPVPLPCRHLIAVSSPLVAPNAVPAQAVPSNIQPNALPSQPAGSAQGAQNNYPRSSLQTLPFYHARPIVPVPPGMEPLPPFRHTAPPRYPDPDAASVVRSRAWYLCIVGVNPGMKWTTWDDFCPNIEPYRGLPASHSPVFRRLDGSLPSNVANMRVLPPPPRPDVSLRGAHFWAVYVGRIPGIYRSLYVFLDCAEFDQF